MKKWMIVAAIALVVIAMLVMTYRAMKSAEYTKERWREHRPITSTPKEESQEPEVEVVEDVEPITES